MSFQACLLSYQTSWCIVHVICPQTHRHSPPSCLYPFVCSNQPTGFDVAAEAVRRPGGGRCACEQWCGHAAFWRQRYELQRWTHCKQKHSIEQDKTKQICRLHGFMFQFEKKKKSKQKMMKICSSYSFWCCGDRIHFYLLSHIAKCCAGWLGLGREKKSTSWVQLLYLSKKKSCFKCKSK